MPDGSQHQSVTQHGVPDTASAPAALPNGAVQRIRVADFARTPGYRTGPQGADEFRTRKLLPAVEAARSTKGGRVIVELDGVSSYAASFLDWAFGDLVRKDGLSREDVQRVLEIRAGSPLFQTYKVLADRYIAEAVPEKAKPIQDMQAA